MGNSGGAVEGRRGPRQVRGIPVSSAKSGEEILSRGDFAFSSQKSISPHPPSSYLPLSPTALSDFSNFLAVPLFSHNFAPTPRRSLDRHPFRRLNFRFLFSAFERILNALNLRCRACYAFSVSKGFILSLSLSLSRSTLSILPNPAPTPISLPMETSPWTPTPPAARPS